MLMKVLSHLGNGKKWDSGWANVKSETVVPTETYLHHNISDQAVDFKGRVSFSGVLRLMLPAHTQFKMMDSVSQMMSGFWNNGA